MHVACSEETFGGWYGRVRNCAWRSGERCGKVPFAIRARKCMQVVLSTQNRKHFKFRLDFNRDFKWGCLMQKK